MRAGEADPPCAVCGGILKTSTVFFGEALDDHDMERAVAAAAACDLLLCVGTTLQVYPVAGMVPVALRRSVPVVVVNAGATPFDDEALVVRGSISEVLPELVR